MKFANTKENLKEVGLDAKALAVSSVSLVVDTVKVPVSICKDIRDKYLERKALKEYFKTHELVVIEKQPEEKATKKTTKKPAVTACEA
jgi:hypothetical protein